MQILKETVIKAPVKKVYAAYADIQGWKQVLPDVIGVQVYYDDGLHQEFDMTVQRGDHQETVHSIRFCYPLSSIEIFQTQPPPLFKSMSGVWKFIPRDDDVLVQATRKFEIKNDAKFDVSILENFLEKNLSSFKEWVERCA
jgi:ribosome-associated toxin RatA of RatAB toxin-antitoxin module